MFLNVTLRWLPAYISSHIFMVVFILKLFLIVLHVWPMHTLWLPAYISSHSLMVISVVAEPHTFVLYNTFPAHPVVAATFCHFTYSFVNHILFDLATVQIDGLYNLSVHLTRCMHLWLHLLRTQMAHYWSK
jgi:hypothetical protein